MSVKMELLELFWVFIKIGFTSFGGLSMVPIINEEMLSHGWMTQEDVANILAIAEMTPGPMGINCATFAGMQVYGMLGGIIAVLGVLAPAFTTTMVAAVCYEKFKSSHFMESILYVIRPICIGLMVAVIYSLMASTYWNGGESPDFVSVFIGGLALVLLLKYKKSVIFVICVSAILGLGLELLLHLGG